MEVIPSSFLSNSGIAPSATAMIRTPSSSSSTLSPLAPPFTVDRRQSYRYPPLSTPSAADFNANGAFDGDGSRNSSSWIDPPLSYNVTPFNNGVADQSSVAYGDTYGAWYGKHIHSSARQANIGADSSAKQDENPAIYMEKGIDSGNNGLSYFHISNPNLAIECDTANSNNSYDRYMSQLVSCSSDPIVYYPATTCSSTAPKNGYSASQHGNLLYNIDDNYVDLMLHNKKDLGIDQYSDGKEGNMKESIIDSKMGGNNMNWNYQKAKTCSSFENEVKTENSMDHSAELKYGFKAKQLNLVDTVAPSSKTSNNLQISSDIIDQPNLSVDSPCWKGVSLSQKFLSSGGEMIGHHHELKESNGSDDLIQGQKLLPITARQLRTSPYQENDGSLVLQSDMKFSAPILGDLSPCISLYGIDKQFCDANAKGSEHAEAGEGEKRCPISHVIGGKSNEGNNSENDSGWVHRNVRYSDQERSAILSSNCSASMQEDGGSQPEAITNDATVDGPSVRNLVVDDHLRKFSIPGVLGQFAKPINSTDLSSKCLMAGNDIRLVIKAMHGLSEVLLSSLSYNGVLDWTECDHELVQLVIGNLETFTSRSKKCNEAGRSQIPVSNSLDAAKKQSNTGTQVSVKDMESYVFERSENNPQAAVVYKNLWLQAEAAMCSMKYELQLSRMKLEMEKNLEHEAKAKEPGQVIKSSRLNSVQYLDPSEFMTPPSLYNPAHNPSETDAGKSSEVKTREQKTIKDHKAEAAVMARLEVLKGRYAKSNAASSDEQPKRSDALKTFKDLPTRLDDLGFVESRITWLIDEDGNSDAHHSASKGAPAEMHRVPNSLHPEISECGCSAPLAQTFLSSMDGQRNPTRYILG